MMASGAYFFIGVQPQKRASLPCFAGSQGLSSGPREIFQTVSRRLILGNPQRLHTVKEVFLFGLKLLVRFASRLLKFGQFLDLLRDVVGLGDGTSLPTWPYPQRTGGEPKAVGVISS